MRTNVIIVTRHTCVNTETRQMVTAKPNRTKTAQLNFYVSEELKAAAVEAAEADQRSLTSLLEKLLTDYCREKGFLPKPAKGKAR